MPQHLKGSEFQFRVVRRTCVWGENRALLVLPVVPLILLGTTKTIRSSWLLALNISSWRVRLLWSEVHLSYASDLQAWVGTWHLWWDPEVMGFGSCRWKKIWSFSSSSSRLQVATWGLTTWRSERSSGDRAKVLCGCGRGRTRSEWGRRGSVWVFPNPWIKIILFQVKIINT